MIAKQKLRNSVSILLLFFFFFSAVLAGGERVAIRARKIYTAAQGVIEDGMILIEDGKISFVGKHFPVPSGTQEIKANIVIPGLIDIHSHLGGKSKVIEIASLGEEEEKEVIAGLGFNSNREEEYKEIIKACNELLHEIEEESKTEDFHFADLEENEKHLLRERELLDSLAGHDYFGSSLQAKAVALMKECQQKFEEFSHDPFSYFYFGQRIISSWRDSRRTKRIF